MSEWPQHPAQIATAAVVYSVVTLIGMAIYGTEAWTRHGEGFSVYFNLLSRISPLEKRGHTVGIRPLLGGLPPMERPRGIVAFVAVMIGTVTYDGLSQGAAWRWVAERLDFLGVHGVATLGLLLAVALVAGFYRLGMAGAHTVPAARTPPRSRGRSSTRWSRSPPSTSPPTTCRSSSSKGRPSATRPQTRSARAGTCSAGLPPGSTTAS